MGEAKRRSIVAVRDALEALVVDTVGGRVQVRWNAHRAATPFGQWAFFVEFLNLTGLYRRWEEDCPLAYVGPNGSRTQDIIGTWQTLMRLTIRRLSDTLMIDEKGVFKTPIRSQVFLSP